ncbi:hypothetical protein RQP46_000834 [Phenoliferia psychrophenolica]
MLLASTVVLALLASSAQAATTSYFDAAYPYAVHEPVNPSSSQPPVIIFMHGSGAKGSASNLGSNVYWDGVGYLIGQYGKGVKTGPPAIVAEQYLTILTILPTSDSDWDPTKVLDVLHDALSKYAHDASRIHCSGYSRGSWGAWRTAFGSPSTFASMFSAAGASGFTEQQLGSLISAKDSVWAFAGEADTKAGTAGTIDSITRLRALNSNGNSNIQMTLIPGADHHDMSMQPFLLDSLWTWVAQQQRGGSSSFAPSSSSASSAVVTTSSAASSSSSSNPESTSQPATLSSSSPSPITTPSSSTNLSPTRPTKAIALSPLTRPTPKSPCRKKRMVKHKAAARAHVDILAARREAST